MTDTIPGAREVDELFTKLEVGASRRVVEELEGMGGETPLVLQTLLARALQEEGRHGEAIDRFLHVLGREPENPVARQFLLFSLFAEGRVEEAGKFLLPGASPVFPHSAFLLKFLRTFWPLRFTTELGAPEPGHELPESPADKVEAEAERLLSSDSAGTPAARRRAAKIQHRAVARFRSGDRKTAHRYFCWAHRLAPDDPLIAAHHGYLSLLMGNSERALAVLEPLVEGSLERFDASRKGTDLPLPDLLVAFAWALHDQGRHGEALRVLSAVHPEGPDDYAAHFVATVCWIMLDEEIASRRAFELVTGSFFIDTWEQILQPFLTRTGEWLSAGAAGHKR